MLNSARAPAAIGALPRASRRSRPSAPASPAPFRTSGSVAGDAFLEAHRAPVALATPRVAATADAPAETFTYQAEVNRLLDLIVNSLYSNKEVFLRELISNASDALDKIRFVSVTDKEALAATSELVIRIKGDKDSRTLVIEDTGIGMSKAELVDSLGTIARSGTAKFMEALKEKAAAGEASGPDGSLIGRFGVGFYSAFLVADRITVETKSNSDASTWEWESSLGSTSYTVREAAAPMTRGTRITLHLKEDCEDLTDPAKLSSLVKTYSEFISFPIDVWASTSVPKRIEDPAATAAARTSWEAAKAAAEEKGEAFSEAAPEAVMKTEYETEWAWKVQNDNKPIWVRNPKEVELDSYNEFYKSTFKEFMDPLAHTHFSIEGDIEFKAIMFLPGMAPFDQQDWLRKSRAIKLYVRRVFISDQFDEDLMPRYLNFVKGVVDSNDLPLNVSREILQESRVVRVMRKRLLRKTLDMIKDLADAEDTKKYDTFYEAFGRNLKLGIIEDAGSREELAKLVQFASSAGEKMTRLGGYVSRMKPDQKSIFYLAADSRAAAEKAPFLEGLAARGLEVLFLTDPIDEVAITNLATFDGKQLVDVTKEDLDLGEEASTAESEKTAAEFAGLTAWMKETLGGKVENVVVSRRVATSPCMLVTSKFGWSANMEKIMKAQTMGDGRAMEYMKGKKIMEINPSNAIIRDLKAQVDGRSAGPAAEAAAMLLFETALLTSGFAVEDASSFAGRIFDMMASKVGGGDGAAPAPGGSQAVTPEVENPTDPW